MLWQLPKLGLGTMLQLAPSQCSISVRLSCRRFELPTAQTSFAEMAAMLRRLLSYDEALGLATLFHDGMQPGVAIAVRVSVGVLILVGEFVTVILGMRVCVGVAVAVPVGVRAGGVTLGVLSWQRGAAGE